MSCSCLALGALVLNILPVTNACGLDGLLILNKPVFKKLGQHAWWVGFAKLCLFLSIAILSMQEGNLKDIQLMTKGQSPEVANRGLTMFMLLIVLLGFLMLTSFIISIIALSTCTDTCKE